MAILHEESGCARKDRKKMRKEAGRELPDPKKMRQSPETGEEAGRELPEEVLETVIAKVPFPSLFKARILSRSWYSKFVVKTTESQSQLVSLCETSAFQSQVTANASRWATYAPAFVSSSSNLMVGFHRSNLMLVFLVNLSQMFPPLPLYNCHSECRIWLEGALVLIHALFGGDGQREKTLYVGNVITGSSRYLTLPRSCGQLGPLCLIAVGCRSYIVLAVYYDLEENGNWEGDLLCIVYYSVSHSWTSTPHKNNDNPALNRLWGFFSHRACMNGKVYFLGDYIPGVKLISYDVEKSAWSIVCEGFAAHDVYKDPSGVFRCGDKVIVVLISKRARGGTLESWDSTIPLIFLDRDAATKDSVYFVRENSIQIFQLDLQSLELVLLSDGPPGNMGFLETSVSDWTKGRYRRLSADANFLYFGWDRLCSSVAKFELNNREWSSIPNSLGNSTPDFSTKRHSFDWIHGSFEPGLNPFVSA